MIVIFLIEDLGVFLGVNFSIVDIIFFIIFGFGFGFNVGDIEW